MALPRKISRIAGYSLFLTSFAAVLLFIANKHKVIDIQQYIPYYLTPSFFQPSSDIYIIDVSINNCFKLNSKNPLCGLPSAGDGFDGDLESSNLGGWIKIDKDLTLGSTFFNKQYFSYKTIKNEAFKNGQLDDDVSDLVITDIAVYAKEDNVDGNSLKIPKKILDEFRKGDVYDEEDEAIYAAKQVQGELHHEDTDNLRASKGNQEYQSKMDQEAKDEQERVKQEEARVKQDQQKAEQQFDDAQKQAELEQAELEAQHEAQGKQQEQKEQKYQKEQKEQKEEEEEEENVKRAQEKEKAQKMKRMVPGAPGGQDISKRTVELELDALKVHYEIPSKEQVEHLGWKYKSHGIWCKYESYKSQKGLTAIDILFGKDSVEPRPNWSFLKGKPLQGVDNDRGREAYLTFRRGPKVDYKSSKYQKPLKVSKDGKFKILQVADLHFSTGYGKCRDPVGGAKDCKADPRTLKFVEKVLDIEKPDLVVCTGDQIFGDESPDSETSIFKALNPFIKRKIPFAVTLGNHDDEGSIPRNELMTMISNLPYSLAANGPEEVAGYGNYLVNIEGASGKNSAILLYFLDTHKYSPNPKVNPGYDWIKETQLSFIEREYGTFKKSIDAYSKIHLSMAFFHIPLPEYRNLEQPYIGKKREGITAPRYNTGARKVLGDLGVKVVSVGHDHCNDYCLQDVDKKDSLDPKKLWLCYGGGAGEGGYGGYGGFVRRLRVFDLDTSKGEVSTWKRLENAPEKVVDKQLIVTAGEVVNF